MGQDSNNPSGGDDQQETVSPDGCLDPDWIVGFVDGEGCFSVSIHRNREFGWRSQGWQINPVFQVSQHQRNLPVLEALRAYFRCGKVRTKGPRSTVMVYAVDRIGELESRILPFFERHTLLVKSSDFVTFALIVRLLRTRSHFTAEGFERVVRLAYSMNADGKQRARPLDEVLAGSSETTR